MGWVCLGDNVARGWGVSALVDFKAVLGGEMLIQVSDAEVLVVLFVVIGLIPNS